MPLVAVVPLVAVGMANALTRAFQRVPGTLIGLVVAGVLPAAEPSGLVTIVIAVTLQVCAELFVARDYGLALLFITPLALLMIDLASPGESGPLLADRAIETLIGTGAALLTILLSELLTRRMPDGPDEA